MTLSTTEGRTQDIGDAIVTVFSFSFKVIDANSVDVFLDRTQQGSGFTVSINSDQETNPGGDVTFSTAPANAVLVTLLRSIATDQSIDYSAYGSFPSETHESGLDKAHLLVQQLNDRLGRILRLHDTDSSGDDMALPSSANRKNNFLVFDANGDISVSSGTGTDAGLRADLASVLAAKGASLIGIEDVASNFTATDLEALLIEFVAAFTTGQLNVDNIRIDGSTISSTFTNGGISLQPNGTGLITVNTNDLLISNGNLKLGTAGKGIDFSINSNAAGMTSELFDYYEEGTFTPTLQDDSFNDSEGQTYATNGQLGEYRRTGNRVDFDIWLSTTSVGTLTAGSTAYIAGLPFTSGTPNSSRPRGAIHFGYGAGLAIPQYSSPTGYIASNTTRMVLALWDTTGGVSTMLIQEVNGTGGEFIVSGSYFI